MVYTVNLTDLADISGPAAAVIVAAYCRDQTVDVCGSIVWLADRRRRVDQCAGVARTRLT